MEIHSKYSYFFIAFIHTFLLPYKRENRKLVKVGINFDTEKRTLSDWKIVEE